MCAHFRSKWPPTGPSVMVAVAVKQILSMGQLTPTLGWNSSSQDSMPLVPHHLLGHSQTRPSGATPGGPSSPATYCFHVFSGCGMQAVHWVGLACGLAAKPNPACPFLKLASCRALSPETHTAYDVSGEIRADNDRVVVAIRGITT